jgi:predicted flavoprotein YhiN
VRADHFLSANPHFCKSALARFRPEQFIALVERHGIAWHEKELGQLFCDESSKQILRLLLDECAAAAVQIETDSEIRQVRSTPDGFALDTARGPRTARKLVVATGGLSIPSMGASGFGYTLAQQFGHALQPTRAGLVPLTLSGRPLEDWSVLSGVALPVEARAGGIAFQGRLCCRFPTTGSRARRCRSTCCPNWMRLRSCASASRRNPRRS